MCVRVAAEERDLFHLVRVVLGRRGAGVAAGVGGGVVGHDDQREHQRDDAEKARRLPRTGQHLMSTRRHLMCTRVQSGGRAGPGRVGLVCATTRAWARGTCGHVNQRHKNSKKTGERAPPFGFGGSMALVRVRVRVRVRQLAARNLKLRSHENGIRMQMMMPAREKER